MKTLTTIAEILKGDLYISEISKDSTDIEIEIGDFLIKADLHLKGYEVPKDFEWGVESYYEITSQEIYNISIFDEDGDEFEVSDADYKVIKEWFQTLKLEI